MEQIIKYKALEYELKGLDDKEGLVTFYASAFNNEDSDGDVIRHGAYSRTIKGNKRIKHLREHNRNLFVGVPTKMDETELGLLVTSQINKTSSVGQNALADYSFFMKMGRSPEHSIGGYFLDFEKKPDGTPIFTPSGGLYVREINLIEFSLVMFGANPDTNVVGLKSLTDAIGFDEIHKALETMIDLPYTDERKTQIEKLAKLLSIYKKDGSDGSQKTPVPPVAKTDWSILNKIKI